MVQLVWAGSVGPVVVVAAFLKAIARAGLLDLGLLTLPGVVVSLPAISPP